MESPSNNTDLKSKVDLRAEHIPANGYGWVPFCGFGELAQKLEYPFDRIRACDVAKDAVDHWKEHHPAADVVQCKAEKYAFGAMEYSWADLDAYANPYKAAKRFLEKANWSDPVVLFMTCGTRSKTVRSKQVFDWNTLRVGEVASRRSKEQFYNWHDEVMTWLETLGVYVVDQAHATRKHMIYMRFTVSRHPAGDQASEMDQPSAGSGTSKSVKERARVPVADRQEAFARNYVETLNATQAALAAGYSPRSAASQGQRLLKNATVQELIDAGVQRKREAADISTDQVIERLRRILMTDVTDVLSVEHETVVVKPSADWPEAARSAVVEVRQLREGVMIKVADKVKTADLLLRHLGGYEPEQVDIKQTGGHTSVNLVFNGKPVTCKVCGKEYPVCIEEETTLHCPYCGTVVDPIIPNAGGNPIIYDDGEGDSALEGMRARKEENDDCRTGDKV